MTLNVASFVSGGGTTMEKAFQAKIPGINPALVVASKSNIGAIEKAQKLGIPHEVLKDTKNPTEILRLLFRYKIDVIFQNGYLPLMPEEVVQVYSHDDISSIFNQHPDSVRADHRDFGGKGMYGSRVTAARVLYLLITGAKEDEVFTESTVQCVHPEFDKGMLLSAKRLNFSEKFEEFKETFELNAGNIGSRVNFLSIQNAIRDFTGRIQDLLLPIEHKNVIEVLQKIGRGEKLEEDPVYRKPLVPENRVPVLEWAKNQGGILFPKG